MRVSERSMLPEAGIYTGQQTKAQKNVSFQRRERFIVFIAVEATSVSMFCRMKPRQALSCGVCQTGMFSERTASGSPRMERSTGIIQPEGIGQREK